MLCNRHTKTIGPERLSFGNCDDDPGRCTNHVEREKLAKEKASVGHPIYIYSDKGQLVVRFGSWH